MQVDDVMDEDVDVKKERQRVINGNTDSDVLQIKGLTKVCTQKLTMVQTLLKNYWFRIRRIILESSSNQNYLVICTWFSL